MTEAYKRVEEVLGVWAEDPRSVEGVMALGLDVRTPDTFSDLWASREFEDMDPREAATRAAIRDAKLPDRLFQPGGYQKKTMKPGIEYLIK